MANGSTESFRIAVISPERELFDGDAHFAVIPGHDGEIGILRGHAPMMALLGEGELRIETAAGGPHRYRIKGGFVQVLDNRISVLSEFAERVD